MLKSTCGWEFVLRASAPVDPFGLVARARGDVDRLKTVLESFGYYEGRVSITINDLALGEPSLGDALEAHYQGKRRTLQGHVRSRTPLQSRPHPDRRLRSGFGSPADYRAVTGRRDRLRVLAGGARLLTTLENQGYAFAKVDPPVAYEDSDKHVLNLSIHVATGPRVQIGEIRFEGLKRVHETGAQTPPAAHG